MNPQKCRLALVVVIISMLAPLPTVAQTSAKTKTCLDKAMTQADLNICASEDAARADAELNAVYKEVLDAAAGRPYAVSKIEAARRAWILYRDAYMDAMFPAKDKLAAYGSIYPMNADFAISALTQHQVVAMKLMLDAYEGKLNTSTP